MHTLTDKAKGCLVAGAAGDALGYPVEFVHSFSRLTQKYGPDGIRAYDEDHFIDGKAQVSDDTQMTLYTAEGLLYAVANHLPIIPAITQAYIAWYALQVGINIEPAYPSKLVEISEINQRRAPGNTCISALSDIHCGAKAVNDSKGCGGIMRIAPIAIYGAAHGWALQDTAKMAGDVAEITHKHPLSTLPSACAAAIIQLCMLSDSANSAQGFTDIVMQAFKATAAAYPRSSYLADLEYIITRTLRLADSEEPDWFLIENALGGGWTAEETLAIAIFCVIRHIHSIPDCLAAAVNHGGDSDSTGAVAGNFIGAIYGIDAIPAIFTDSLQLCGLIADTAQSLCI